ncbi:hypothetical protein OROGR_024933 [Orobanche gracilis]
MEVVRGMKPHVLVVGVPGQGHVKPLLKLCRQIANHGIKVTFANLQTTHEKIVAASDSSSNSGEPEEEEGDNFMILTPIPDTRSPDERKDVFNMENIKRTLPRSITALIERINSSNPGERISCIIADLTFKWIVETADELGLEALLFSAASAASMALIFRIPELVEEGRFDSNGCTPRGANRWTEAQPRGDPCEAYASTPFTTVTPRGRPRGNVKKGEIISLSEDIPSWGEDEFGWSFPSNRKVQKMFFEAGVKREYHENIKRSKWVIINTCYELESSGCGLNPNFRPVGPLLLGASDRKSGNFYPEDESCLSWLDSKSTGSVIYVSFGSVAVLSQQQLDELALGLELSGHAFLWVVRPGLADGSRAVYPAGFLGRVGEKMGKIVGWAPQEKVLSHPSVGCFLSHCGWNSTLEGLSKGVPFLCWPYFADQFHNQKYICDKWEIGLKIRQDDENGIRSRHEIKEKIDMLFSNHNLKVNALALKEMCAKSVNQGGSSDKNLQALVDHLRSVAGRLRV